MFELLTHLSDSVPRTTNVRTEDVHLAGKSDSEIGEIRDLRRNYQGT